MSTPNPGTTPWVPMWNLNGGMDLRYQGAWAAGNYYDGDVVVYQGVTYICVRPTNKAPTPWAPGQLVVSPSVRAYNTASQSIPSGTWTALTFSTARYDQGPAAHWNVNTPTRLTCQVAGTYAITGQILFNGATGGTQRAACILYNGVNYVGNNGQSGATLSASTYARLVASAVLKMNVGDYIELIGFQDSGAALTTYGMDGTTWSSELSMALVGGMQGPPGLAANVNYGTTLPPTPADGQEAILVDSITNPSYQWRFRYNAGSTSSYKWEFTGGSVLCNSIVTGETLGNAASPVDLATVGPVVSIPRAGEYTARWGFLGQAGNNYIGSILYDGSNVRVSNMEADVRTGNFTACMQEEQLPAISAVGTLKMRYFNQDTVTATFYHRHLSVTPKRVA